MNKGLCNVAKDALDRIENERADAYDHMLVVYAAVTLAKEYMERKTKEVKE